MTNFLKTHLTSYKIAIALSSGSMILGVLREFLIVGLLGFTTSNDTLQLYLSIFYTIGLTIDAMRLACLNLYTLLTLWSILLAASIVSLPLVILISLIMSYATSTLDTNILAITIVGSYLNLIAALLITYKQRDNMFLLAQLINIIPNFILIPGIIACYLFAAENFVFAIVCLTSFIPLLQCILLLLLPNKTTQPSQTTINLLASIMIFLRHFTATIGDQLFQIIARTAFYKYGIGYLSLYAIGIRIFTCARFILVDSFIGSKLATWHTVTHEEHYFSKLIKLNVFAPCLVTIALIISLPSTRDFLYSAMQMSIILTIGFFFSTFVRVIYFKINQYENNTNLVIRFAICEFIGVLISYLLVNQVHYPILTLLWIGYIAKPFAQLIMLRNHYYGLRLNEGNG